MRSPHETVSEQVPIKPVYCSGEDFQKLEGLLDGEIGIEVMRRVTESDPGHVFPKDAAIEVKVKSGDRPPFTFRKSMRVRIVDVQFLGPDRSSQAAGLTGWYRYRMILSAIRKQ